MNVFHFARPSSGGPWCQVIRQSGADGEVVVNFLRSPVVANWLASQFNAGDWRRGRKAS